MVSRDEIRNLRASGVRLPTIDFRPYLLPAKQQNPFGACTAFTCSALQEFYLFRKDGRILPEHESSPGFLYYQSRATTCNIPGHTNTDGTFVKDKDEGSHFPVYVNNLINNGCCHETFYPYSYDQTTFPNYADHYNTSIFKKPESSVISDASSKKLFSGYRDLNNDENEWIAELFNGNILGLRVYKYTSDFSSRGGDEFIDGITSEIDPSTGDPYGGHAMAIVGYIPNMRGREVFIVRNSWGINWKDAGYCYYTINCLKQSLRSVYLMIPNFTPQPINNLPQIPSITPPVPQPIPSPVPPVTPPTPPPATGGKYTKRWWRFDDINQFNLALNNNLSPQELERRRIGESFDNAELEMNPNINFTDTALKEFRGVIGLGACRNDNKNYWRWDSRATSALAESQNRTQENLRSELKTEEEHIEEFKQKLKKHITGYHTLTKEPRNIIDYLLAVYNDLFTTEEHQTFRIHAVEDELKNLIELINNSLDILLEKHFFSNTKQHSELLKEYKNLSSFEDNVEQIKDNLHTMKDINNIKDFPRLKLLFKQFYTDLFNLLQLADTIEEQILRELTNHSND